MLYWLLPLYTTVTFIPLDKILDMDLTDTAYKQQDIVNETICHLLTIQFSSLPYSAVL